MKTASYTLNEIVPRPTAYISWVIGHGENFIGSTDEFEAEKANSKVFKGLMVQTTYAIDFDTGVVQRLERLYHQRDSQYYAQWSIAIPVEGEEASGVLTTGPDSN